MNCLLTSSGIRNKSIHDALVEMLGKPITESNALFIPTAIYPFSGGAQMAWQAIFGKSASNLCQLGWKSLGLLELTTLSGIEKDVWAPSIENTDVILVWGGDPVYLSYWMHQSGFADLTKSLRREVVYVGVSAGSMAASSFFGETFTSPPGGKINALTMEDIIFSSPGGEIKRTFVKTHGVGLVDFAIIPHLDNEHHPDASLANAERWAARLPVPVYAIDDETAIQVMDGHVAVVSEGQWKLFMPSEHTR